MANEFSRQIEYKIGRKHFVRIPKGLVEIARRLNAGFEQNSARVPEGRLDILPLIPTRSYSAVPTRDNGKLQRNSKDESLKDNIFITKLLLK